MSVTYLTSQDKIQVKIPGFHHINKPQQSKTEKGGGVGACFASCLPVPRREDLDHLEVECIWLGILFSETGGILIGIYRPPDTSKYLVNLYKGKLRSILGLVSIENKEILVLGDLNCNYLINSEHKEIKHIITASGLKQLITSPMRITNQSSTLIDVICSIESKIISITKVIPMGRSEHETVLYARKLDNIKQPSRDITCRNFSNYNPALYCDDIKIEDFDQLHSQTCITSAIEKFNSILSRNIDKLSPFIQKRVKGCLCLKDACV